MHDSRMIAEVGGMLKVSGSRIATPLAPPSPGSTPMITPRMMPTIISIRLNGLSTTAKPWNSKAISVTCEPLVAQERQWIECALEQRHLEPDLEHQKCDRHHRDGDDDALEPRVLAD